MLILQPWQTLLNLLPLLALIMALVGAALAVIAVMRYTWAVRRLAAFADTALLNALPYPVVIRDGALKLTACNTAYALECGQSVAALRGSGVDHVLACLRISGIDHGELSRWYASIAASGTAASTERTLLRDSNPVRLQHWAAPIKDAAGRVQGLVAGWLDLSVHQQVLAELAQARHRSEAALRAKATFLASISHDIHTPMNAVVGLLELTLMRASLNSPERQQLETALQAARSLLALIRDLLDLSRLEAGEFDLRPVVTPLRAVIGEIADIYAPAAQSKGLKLHTSVDQTVAPLHQADPLRVKQIMNNLVSNAIRFSADGPVRIEVTASAAHGGKQCVQFTVSDTGPGIAPDVLPRLFEPFAHGARERDGAGLGLSICKRLVEAMGGHIRVYSRPQRGVRVRVRLPLPVVTDTEASSASAQPQALLSILVVDDHPANRMVLQHQLQALGHVVTCAEGGTQALQAAARQAFQLVICDCAMPGMNGADFTRALRSRGGLNATTPVLGYTAGVPQSDLQDLYDAGMDAVLVKPVDLTALQQALQAYLPKGPQPVPLNPQGPGPQGTAPEGVQPGPPTPGSGAAPMR